MDDQDSAYYKTLNRVESLEHAILSAVSELKRWQYSDDPEQVRHSIDTAVNTLQRA